MGFQVKGSTALVTGANRGIGKSIVETLLQHGAKKVYAAVRDLSTAEPLVAAHGTAVQPIQVDLNQPETIAAAANVATDVDLVINNAGILRCAEPLADDVISTFQEELEVNVYGLLRVAKAFAPVLKANGGGALVQLNSVASLRNFAVFSTYSASKAASYSFTQALRDQLSEQGTQVLSVHPGPIDTNMAVDAGIQEMAESASIVAEGIVVALSAGDFHLFPDSYARQVGDAYASFVHEVVEGNG